MVKTPENERNFAILVLCAIAALVFIGATIALGLEYFRQGTVSLPGAFGGGMLGFLVAIFVLIYLASRRD